MTRPTKRLLLIGLATVIVVAIGGYLAFDWMTKQSLYRFGSVRAGENLRGPLAPPAQDDRPGWQVEPDITLHFDAHGEGSPVLIVHGGPGMPYAKAWKGLEPLTDQFRFYYYHQRGCGLSTRPFDRFTSGSYYANMTELERTLGLGAQIADIERTRQILRQDRMTIIGHSFGGFIASMYAAEFPNRVEKLILVAPAGVLTPPDEDRNLFRLARETLPHELHSQYDKLLARYFDFGSIFSRSDAELAELHEGIGGFLLPAMGYDPSHFESGPTSGGWTVFALYFSSGRAFDFRPAVAGITAPTLIVQGADDDISLAGSRTYEQVIPNAEFVSLGGDNDLHAGHFVFDDLPDAFAVAIERFLGTP